MQGPAFKPQKTGSVGRLLGAEFENQLSDAIERNLVTGIGIGILRGNQSFTAAAGSGIAEDSLFEIGSITKSFTSELLHELIGRGDLCWNDRLDSFIFPPSSASTLPQKEMDPITLGDLVLHRSGLPLLPSNFKPNDVSNPYGSYSESDLLAYLKQSGLTKPQGAPFTYSNVGYAALGLALERASGRSYAQLLEEEILKPLHLTSTRTALSGGDVPKLVQGYTQGGRAVPGWRQKAFAPAGALCSTVPDMLRWCEFSILQMRARAAGGVVDSVDAGTAMGWEKSNVHDWYGREGVTGGFSSFIGVSLALNSAVVLLANRSCLRVLRVIAGNAMRTLHGEALVPLQGSYGKQGAVALDLIRCNRMSALLVRKLKESKSGAFTVGMLHRLLKLS